MFSYLELLLNYSGLLCQKLLGICSETQDRFYEVFRRLLLLPLKVFGYSVIMITGAGGGLKGALLYCGSPGVLLQVGLLSSDVLHILTESSFDVRFYSRGR